MRTKVFSTVVAVTIVAFAASAQADPVAKDSLNVEPSGQKAIFTVVEDGNRLKMNMFVKDGKDVELLRSTKVPPSFEGSGIKLTVDQEGDSYAKNGGQGFLSSSDSAIYFGWDIDGKGKLTFF